VEVQLHVLTLAVDGGESSASCPSCLTPRERDLNTHLTGGWVNPRAGVDAVARRKNPFLVVPAKN
jgi:hypothetical protein